MYVRGVSVCVCGCVCACVSVSVYDNISYQTTYFILRCLYIIIITKFPYMISKYIYIRSLWPPFCSQAQWTPADAESDHSGTGTQRGHGRKTGQFCFIICDTCLISVNSWTLWSYPKDGNWKMSLRSDIKSDTQRTPHFLHLIYFLW